MSVLAVMSPQAIAAPEDGPVEARSWAAEGLWTRRELAASLRRSVRWLDLQLARRPEEPGSIPHVVLPGPGRRRAVRFLPEHIRLWLAMGCPSAADFARGLAARGRGRR